MFLVFFHIVKCSAKQIGVDKISITETFHLVRATLVSSQHCNDIYSNAICQAGAEQLRCSLSELARAADIKLNLSR